MKHIYKIIHVIYGLNYFMLTISHILYQRVTNKVAPNSNRIIYTYNNDSDDSNNLYLWHEWKHEQIKCIYEYMS